MFALQSGNPFLGLAIASAGRTDRSASIHIPTLAVYTCSCNTPTHSSPTSNAACHSSHYSASYGPQPVLQSVAIPAIPAPLANLTAWNQDPVPMAPSSFQPGPALAPTPAIQPVMHPSRHATISVSQTYPTTQLASPFVSQSHGNAAPVMSSSFNQPPADPVDSKIPQCTNLLIATANQLWSQSTQLSMLTKELHHCSRLTMGNSLLRFSPPPILVMHHYPELSHSLQQPLESLDLPCQRLRVVGRVTLLC